MTQYNDALANLDGLSNFTSVGHDLIIQYNDGLNNLDKPSNLTSVGRRLEIDYNPDLCQSVVGAFVDGVVVGGNVLTHDNDDGC